MTDLERHNCDLFVRSLNLLHVNDDGLTDATNFDDVQIKIDGPPCSTLFRVVRPSYCRSAGG